MTNSDAKPDFASRIETLIEISGGVASLSRAAGVSRAAIDKWRKGGADPSAGNIRALAEATKVSPLWLLSGSGEPTGATIEAAKQYPTVPLYDAEASAGHGFFVDYAPVKDHIPFTEEFLMRSLGRTHPDGLICVYARGDSMEPTISNGDLLLVDTHKREMAAAVFALVTEYGFWVKRLNPGLEAIEVISDNPTYGKISIRPDLADTFEILGRVVWVGHTM